MPQQLTKPPDPAASADAPGKYIAPAAQDELDNSIVQFGARLKQQALLNCEKSADSRTLTEIHVRDAQRYLLDPPTVELTRIRKPILKWTGAACGAVASMLLALAFTQPVGADAVGGGASDPAFSFGTLVASIFFGILGAVILHNCPTVLAKNQDKYSRD